MRSERNGVSLAVVKEQMFAVGGSDSLIEMYQEETNIWERNGLQLIDNFEFKGAVGIVI